MNLLGTASTKTEKGEAKGYLTGILYLQPGNLSGRELCGGRSPGCTNGCLYGAGRGVMRSVQEGRARKTRLFIEQRDEFMRQLVEDIEALIRKASRDGMTPTVRLNGTSDINWLAIPAVRNGVEYANIVEAFSEIQFYDYTKLPKHAAKPASSLPSNYDLTFSRSETNEATALLALRNGYRVAVVFDTPKGEALPASWNGFPVIDADETDLRFLDAGAVVAGLRAKGTARHDASGFVVHAA